MRIEILNEERDNRIERALRCAEEITMSELNEVGMSREDFKEMLVGFAEEFGNHSKKLDLNKLVEILASDDNTMI